MIARAVGVALLVSALTACHSGGKAGPTVTVQSTITQTRSTSAQPYTPPAPGTVAPLPPGTHVPRGELERRCPYIASTPQQDPTINIAEIIGSHVARTTVITSMNPVGCRFYFYRPPYQALVDIVTYRFATPTQAYNAMVATSATGTQATGQPKIVPNVDAVVFRTKFFGPDGVLDWACAFAVKNVLVVVHTDRKDPAAFNALQIAKAIAPKF